MDQELNKVQANLSDLIAPAVATIVLVLQEGQIPRFLHENEIKKSVLQQSQCAHAKPLARLPHSKYFSNVFSTNLETEC